MASNYRRLVLHVEDVSGDYSQGLVYGICGLAVEQISDQILSLGASASYACKAR
jgi:hypothetical protein